MKPRYTAWYGHKYPPVPSTTMVELLFRDGSRDLGFADEYYWLNDGYSADIIAYRVIEED